MRELASSSLPAFFAPEEKAGKGFLDFFTSNIRNPNARRAYSQGRGELRRSS